MALDEESRDIYDQSTLRDDEPVPTTSQQTSFVLASSFPNGINTSTPVANTNSLSCATVKCPKCSESVRRGSQRTVNCAFCDETVHSLCISNAAKSIFITESTVRETKSSSCPLVYACESCRKSHIENRNNTSADLNKTLTNNSNTELISLRAEIQRLLTLNANLMANPNARAAPGVAPGKRQRIDTSDDQLIETIENVVAPLISTELSSVKANIAELMSLMKKQVVHTPWTKFSTSHLDQSPSTRRQKPNDPTPAQAAAQPRRNRYKKPVENAASIEAEKDALNKKTFAQVASISDTKRDRIINVHIIDPSDADLTNALQTDPITKKIQLVSIKTKTANLLTLECRSHEDAFQLTNQLNLRYKDKINASISKPSTPKVKITNLPNTINQETFAEDLRMYNYWLADADYEVDRMYTINNGKRSYTNVILSCDLSTQISILTKGSVMYGLKERYCFEHVHVLQCMKCLAFGHTSVSCKLPVKCRKCSGAHAHSECTSETICCVNCANFNTKSSTKYDTVHIATSDLCRCRTNRINGLKEFINARSKNES